MFDFSENDVAIRNGDFAVTEDASRQNGGLILMKIRLISFSRNMV